MCVVYFLFLFAFSLYVGIVSVWGCRRHIKKPVDACVYFLLGCFWPVTLPLAWWITRRGK